MEILFVCTCRQHNRIWIGDQIQVKNQSLASGGRVWKKVEIFFSLLSTRWTWQEESWLSVTCLRFCTLGSVSLFLCQTAWQVLSTLWPQSVILCHCDTPMVCHAVLSRRRGDNHSFSLRRKLDIIASRERQPSTLAFTLAGHELHYIVFYYKVL